MFPQARVNIQFEITQDLNSCLIWFINTWSCTTWKTFRLSNIFYLKKSLLSWIKWCLILVIAINWLLYTYIMQMYKCHIRVNVFLILLAVLEIDIVWILYPIYMQYLRRYFDKNVLYYRILKLFLGWPYVCHFNNSINASVHTHKTHILNIQFGFPGLDIFSTNYMLWYSAFAQYPWLSTSLNQGVLVYSVGV